VIRAPSPGLTRANSRFGLFDDASESGAFHQRHSRAAYRSNPRAAAFAHNSAAEKTIGILDNLMLAEMDSNHFSASIDYRAVFRRIISGLRALLARKRPRAVTSISRRAEMSLVECATSLASSKVRIGFRPGQTGRRRANHANVTLGRMRDLGFIDRQRCTRRNLKICSSATGRMHRGRLTRRLHGRR